MPRDNPVRIAECLKSLGLTKYEALVYIALLKVVSATASEIHEISGVPRASVYPVLDQLQDKNLVSVSQSAPKRFAALSPDDGITKLLGHIERDAKDARDALSLIYRERMNAEHGSEELIWNVYGIEAIRKRLTALISSARKEIRIISHPRLLSPDIRQVLSTVADHTTIEIITPHWSGEIPKNMKVYLIEHPEIQKDLTKAKDMMAGGICIVDGRKVLVVVGSRDDDAVALFFRSGRVYPFLCMVLQPYFRLSEKTG